MLYAVYPGSVKTYDGATHILSYEELIVLYGVDAQDCVNGWTVPEYRKMFYIHLKPRQDGLYPNMTEQVELGDEIKWGPDFDGRKRFTMETNPDELYAGRAAEEKPEGRPR